MSLCMSSLHSLATSSSSPVQCNVIQYDISDDAPDLCKTLEMTLKVMHSRKSGFYIRTPLRYYTPYLSIYRLLSKGNLAFYDSFILTRSSLRNLCNDV